MAFLIIGFQKWNKFFTKLNSFNKFLNVALMARIRRFRMLWQGKTYYMPPQSKLHNRLTFFIYGLIVKPC